MAKTIATNQTSTWSLLTALYIAANIGLPHLFHLIPGGGVMFLPIYFFTAFASVCYGKWSGVLTGVMSPLLGYLLFSMPAAVMLPDMILKGILLSIMLSAMVGNATSMPLKVIMVPLSVAIAWLTAGVLELAIRDYEIAFQDFFTGIPGLLLMTIGGWIALFFNKRIAR